MRADLIIVGAGMVGSTLALALEHCGLDILIVDGSPLSVAPFAAQAPFEPRVSALSREEHWFYDKAQSKLAD